jgi:hypothetical protein
MKSTLRSFNCDFFDAHPDAVSDHEGAFDI